MNIQPVHSVSTAKPASTSSLNFYSTIVPHTSILRRVPDSIRRLLSYGDPTGGARDTGCASVNNDLSFRTTPRRLAGALCVGLCVLVTILCGSSSAHACTSCFVRDNVAYCISGYVAELCQTSADGCIFSGSRDCGDGGCFLSSTPVVTLTRGSVPIASVKIGEDVLTLLKDGRQAWVTVLDQRTVLRVGYWEINNTLQVTGDHPFYVDGAWITAENLQIGDALVGRGGKRTPVSSKQWIADEGVRVVYLDVVSPDTFIAGGFLVKNKDANRIKQ